ncbi:ATP-binding protein [Streptomyces chrestomyceticus]|uniref:ATP-binding protein n=1 Tax=Streptomyces chrestomyceticus TaxID=68185 RepID=UPI0037B37AD9
MSLSRTRRFSRRRTSVRAARDFVSSCLAEWGMADRLEDIRLCASELATNAVLHGVPPGREFCVQIEVRGGLVLLGVRDSGDGLPEGRPESVELSAGRGLFLLRALADDFGVTQHVVGKTVWVVFKNGGRAEAVPQRKPTGA